MSRVHIKTKILSSDQQSVKITEYVETDKAFRSFDPQSGAHISFVPVYQLVMTRPWRKIEWLSFEEVLTKYPEFFK